MALSEKVQGKLTSSYNLPKIINFMLYSALFLLLFYTCIRYFEIVVLVSFSMLGAHLQEKTQYHIVCNTIDNQCKVTCLSREVYWFICLNECHWLVDFDHDFPDFL